MTGYKGSLPKGMEDCTILLKECHLGHMWLTAANWVDHPCPTCERNELRVMVQRWHRDWSSRGSIPVHLWDADAIIIAGWSKQIAQPTKFPPPPLPRQLMRANKIVIASIVLSLVSILISLINLFSI